MKKIYRKLYIVKHFIEKVRDWGDSDFSSNAVFIIDQIDDVVELLEIKENELPDTQK